MELARRPPLWFTIPHHGDGPGGLVGAGIEPAVSHVGGFGRRAAGSVRGASSARAIADVDDESSGIVPHPERLVETSTKKAGAYVRRTTLIELPPRRECRQQTGCD